MSEKWITYEEAVERIDQSKVTWVFAIAAIITALGGFLFGYDTGVIASALPFVIPYFHMTEASAQAWLVAGESLMAAIGALVAGPIIDRFGRKSLLLADGAMYFIFAILTALATSSLLLILWRSLIGFAIGADTAVATGYIAEFAPAKRRGTLAILQQVMIVVGMTISEWVGYYLAFFSAWRWMFGLGAVPAILLFAFRFLLPESPRWLLVQGREEDARKAFAKLGVYISERIRPPQREKGFRELLSNRAVRRALLIVGLWLVFQQVTGINIILYYGSIIYEYLGWTGPKSIIPVAISDTVGLVTVIVSLLLIDKWGRRKLGIFGYGGVATALAIMLAGAYELDVGVLSLAVPLIFAAMVIFLITFETGVGGVGWVLQGEVLPTEFRGRGAGILAAIDWFANWVIIFIFPFWLAVWGMYSFWIFEFILGVLSVIFVFTLVPETKGVPLEKMPELFSRPFTEMRRPLNVKAEEA